MTGTAPLILGLPPYPLRFDYLPLPLVILLFVAISAIVIRLGLTTIKWQGPARGWTTIGVRLAGVWVLCLLIAGARWERRNTDVEVIVLRDASASTASTAHPRGVALADAEDDYLRSVAAKKPKNDSIGVIRFDDRATIEAFPDHQLRSRVPAMRRDSDGTNIADAIHLALASFRGDAMRRLVLMSDGNATQGDTAAAVSAAIGAGVTIDVVPLKYNVSNDVAIERIVAPFHKHEGEPFTLEVVVRSTHQQPVYGSIRVTDGGLPVDLDPRMPGVQAMMEVTARPGVTPVRIKVPPASPGLHTYAATIETAPQADALPANDSAETMTFVSGRLRVLYVDGVGGISGGMLPTALASEGISIGDGDRVTPDHFPADVRLLQGYDAIVIANVPRGVNGLGREQELALCRYVRDLGGGLLVVGGPAALGAGNWQDSELESVLPVSVTPPDRRQMPPGALVIAMDRSGSMADPISASGGASKTSKQDAAVSAAVQALYALYANDYIGVIGFNTTPQWFVPLRLDRDPGITAASIRTMSPQGGTSIGPAIEQAIEALSQLSSEQASSRHILLMTDGVSEPANYDAMLTKLQQHHITLSTVAVGSDADVAMLSQLALRGGGCAYTVADAAKLREVFVREATTLRRPFVVEPPGGIPVLADPSSGSRKLVDRLGNQPPRLGGMVLTSPRKHPGVQVPLFAAGGDHDAVLVHWLCGLGHAAVFAGDATPRWASAWLQSPVYGKFWAEAVRSISRPAISEDFEIRTIPDGPRTKLIVEAADGGSGRGWSFLTIAGRCTSPDAHAPAQDLHLQQTGPGIYETTFDTTDPGAYFCSLQVTTPSGKRGALWAGAIVAADRELRDLQSNDALLAQIAQDTGGRLLPAFDATAGIFSRAGLRASVSSQPLRDLLIPWLLAIMLIDVAVRRVAFDANAMRHLAIVANDRARAFFDTRKIESAPAMLGALRRTRTELRENRLKPGDCSPQASHPINVQQQLPTESAPGGYVVGLRQAKQRAREIIRQQNLS